MQRALIQLEPRAATVRANGDCELLVVRRDDFDSLLGSLADMLGRTLAKVSLESTCPQSTARDAGGAGCKTQTLVAQSHPGKRTPHNVLLHRTLCGPCPRFRGSLKARSSA